MPDKENHETQDNSSPNHVSRKRSRSPILLLTSSSSTYEGSRDSDIRNSPSSKRHRPEENPLDTSSIPSSFAAPQTLALSLPQSENQSAPGIVESVLSQLFTHFNQCRKEREEQLLLWGKNGIPLSHILFLQNFLGECPPDLNLLRSLIGYVNPGATLLPIGDPELYTFFARTHMGGSSRPRRWQTAEFVGDRIYARCLAQLLFKWRLPGPCITLLFQVLTSNRYIERLCSKTNLLKYCIGIANQPIEGTMTNKAQADAFEVTPRCTIYNSLPFSLLPFPYVN
jgi:hypothetical protein